MKRIVILLFILSTVLTACSSLRQQLGEALQQADKILQTTGLPPIQPIEQTFDPVSTGISPSCAPALPPLSAGQRSKAQLIDDLQSVMNSPEWQELGLEQSLMQKWSDFAQGINKLTDNQYAVLGDFLNQRDQWDKLLAGTIVPGDTQPALRVRELGVEYEHRLVLYAIDEQTLMTEGTERLFLISRDASGKTTGLFLAPGIENMQQRINPDGAYVQYLSSGGKCILLADARRLDTRRANEKILKERLDQIYANEHDPQSSTYPRFHYNITGEAAGFYAIETILTYNQVIRLHEALELFTRPEFAPFKPLIFAEGIAYLVVDKIGKAAGLTYTGAGVVELDRRDLFGNRYELASVIAHEGSHVLQGSLNNDTNICDQILAREIGDGTISQDFYSWEATQLLQAIQDGRIGAYHVSLWSMFKLGLKDLEWIRQAIRTGQVNGRSVVLCE